MTITEIVSRSEQGTTRPFLCRAENDALFYVKGRYAGYRALCCEWVAGRFGQLVGLPIPHFCIAEVPAPLIRDSGRMDASDLGSGMVFASQLVEDAQEITFSDVARIDMELKRKVLLFDWWVRNADRTLTEFGGNPNLLRSVGSLQVFDQNLAFDDTFDEYRFWQSHVFNDAGVAWPEEFKAAMMETMRRALAQLPSIWQELPEVWLPQAGLDLAAVRELLERFETSPNEFWAIRK